MDGCSDGERNLITHCLALIGPTHELSARERVVAEQARNAHAVHDAFVDDLRERVRAGEDPLGDEFLRVRCSLQRRLTGAIYTPQPVVRSMTTWLSQQGEISRVVDPGAGSGRFILAAGRAFPKAQLIAIEPDPVAALMLRANVCAHGWLSRTAILSTDYRNVELAPSDGATAFVGNPPYLRHHHIEPKWKAWYASAFGRFGIRASALAGLHLHFLLKTCLIATRGDVGTLITPAEWLDVNYGSALRQLFAGQLGGIGLHVLEPAVAAFPGTATTAAIVCFRIGEVDAPVRVRSVPSVEGLDGLARGALIERVRLRTQEKWSPVVRPAKDECPTGTELGELFRVHRGQVTGANQIWIAGAQAQELPDRVKLAAVTKAVDLFKAGSQLDDPASLRRVIDLPVELDQLCDDERARIHAFLAWARARGAHSSYIARHRKAWWSVGLRSPAPILCTYMARRAPQFTLNTCGARHINVAHGLYPRAPISVQALTRLVSWLNRHVDTGSGRTYAGGLTKFEPREIERLRVPDLEASDP